MIDSRSFRAFLHVFRDALILCVSLVIRALEHLAFWIPLKKNQIYFYAHYRKGYTCNPKYIAEAIMKNYPGKFQLIWASDYPDTVADLKEKGFRVVKTHSLCSFWERIRSRVLVINDHLPAYTAKRKDQLLINTWHGSGAYKKIGFSLNNYNYFEKRLFEYQYMGTDMVLSGCKAFSNAMAEGLGLPARIFALTGTPRNDVFFQDNTEQAKALRRKYGLNRKLKIALYAPTFRGQADGNASMYGLDIVKILAALEHRFGGRWCCMYRAHYFYQQRCSGTEDRVLDVSDYPDMQELLAAADVLITDYSSSAWDFSITYRPAFLYATDLKSYRQNDRDFYTPIEKWPYPLAQDNEELFDCIVNFDEESYREAVRAHHKKLGLYETGHASDDVAKIICHALGK